MRTYEEPLRVLVSNAIDTEGNARVVVVEGEGHHSVVQERDFKKSIKVV